MKDAIDDKLEMIQMFFKCHIENHVSTEKKGHCMDLRDRIVKIPGRLRMFSVYYCRLVRKKLDTETVKVEKDERSREITAMKWNESIFIQRSENCAMNALKHPRLRE